MEPGCAKTFFKNIKVLPTFETIVILTFLRILIHPYITVIMHCNVCSVKIKYLVSANYNAEDFTTLHIT